MLACLLLQLAAHIMRLLASKPTIEPCVREPDGGGTGVASEDGRAREPRGPSSSPFQRALTFGPTFNFGPAGTLLLLLVGAPSRIGYSFGIFFFFLIFQYLIFVQPSTTIGSRHTYPNPHHFSLAPPSHASAANPHSAGTASGPSCLAVVPLQHFNLVFSTFHVFNFNISYLQVQQFKVKC